jgi:hypothetical protein
MRTIDAELAECAEHQNANGSAAVAEAVKLATAILERAPATRDDHELDRS